MRFPEPIYLSLYLSRGRLLSMRPISLSPSLGEGVVGAVGPATIWCAVVKPHHRVHHTHASPCACRRLALAGCT